MKQTQDNGLILRGIQDTFAFRLPPITAPAQVDALTDRFARFLDKVRRTV